MKAIFMLQQEDMISRVYARPVRESLEKLLEFFPPLTRPEDLESRREELREVDYIFSTWGMPALDAPQIERYLPRLKAVFYGAGTVQGFARPFLERGVRVFSAADANAVPVAEFTLAQIILANKGYFQNAALNRTSREKAKEYFAACPGSYDTTVGILGAGKIGRGVIRRLRGSDLRVMINVFDPFLPGAEAEKLGVQKRETLEEVFSASFVISNHLANNEQTRGMLTYRHFSLMRDNGIFINTARGAQVVEEDLIRALREQPARTALLDVTWPEPPEPGHPFYTLENVFLSTHIAGSSGNETARMGDYMLDEFRRITAGEPALYEVTLPMLATMA